MSLYNVIIFFSFDCGMCVFIMAARDVSIASTSFCSWIKYFCYLGYCGSSCQNFLDDGLWTATNTQPLERSCSVLPICSADSPAPSTVVRLRWVNTCTLRPTPGMSHGLNKCLWLLLLLLSIWPTPLYFSNLISKSSPSSIVLSCSINIEICFALEHMTLFHTLCLWSCCTLFLDRSSPLFFQHFFWSHKGADFYFYSFPHLCNSLPSTGPGTL